MAMVMAVGAGACQQAREHDVREPLRVSAGHQLTCFDAQSGSSAYARELVSPFVTELAVIEHREPSAVALWPHVVWPRASAGELCDRVYADDPGVIISRELKEGACVLGFDSPASRAEHGAHLRVDDGPYRLTREVPLGGAGKSPCTAELFLDGRAPTPLLERIELRRKHTGNIDDIGMDEIHLVAMPLQEQWRRIFARDIDVVASAPAMYQARFREMDSVRTVLLPSSSAVALYFNIRAGAWSTARARRRLAALLDLDAIARVACRDPACRDLGPYTLALESEPGSRPHAGPHLGTELTADPALPARVTITLMADDSISVKAAQVISYQLRRQLDIEIVLDRRPITDINQVLASGEFDVLLLPLGLPGSARAGDVIERIRIGGWRDRDFERAVEQADDQDIAAILHAQVPVVPLFRYMQFAAIDEHYCGGAPSSQTSWLWLADLLACRGAKAR